MPIVSEWIKYINNPHYDEESYVENITLSIDGVPLDGNIWFEDTYANLSPDQKIVIEDGVIFSRGFGVSLEEDFQNWKSQNTNRIIVLDVPMDKFDGLMDLLTRNGYDYFISNAPYPNVDIHQPSV